MEWQPIENYDKLKQKPKLAVFLFEGTPPRRGGKGKFDLCPTTQTQRNYGNRVCTHWIPLPDAPSST